MRRGFLTTVLGPALVIACTASTEAQDQSDTAYLAARLNKVLEFEPTGNQVPWQNPATGKHGVIVVERTYFLDPKTPCRDFSYTVEGDFSRSRELKGVGCRDKGGEWHFKGDSDLAEAAKNPDSSDPGPSDSLIAFGVGDEVLEDPPVELRLGDEELREFAPRARRNDSAKLQRFAGEEGSDDKGSDEEAQRTLPSGPGPEAESNAVAALLESLPGPSLACDAAPAGAETVETKELDLVIVLDTTASMRRDLDEIQADLLSAVRLLRRMLPSLNVGLVAFRDRKDEYLTRAFQLSPMTEDNQKRLRIFVERLEASGGGDVPEALDEALGVAEAMAWRPTALGQIVVIGDAPPPRPAWRSALAAAHRFCADAGEIRRSVSAVFTGRRRYGFQFYERLAKSGGGRFTAGQHTLIESVLLSVLGEKRS